MHLNHIVYGSFVAELKAQRHRTVLIVYDDPISFQFLQDVFDALFNILSDLGKDCAMAVLKVLVRNRHSLIISN